MPERSSSTTAVNVALLRAAHQIIDDEPRILDDPIIVRLLDHSTLERIHETGRGCRLRSSGLADRAL